MTKRINKLEKEKAKYGPGRPLGPPRVYNEGLEQALAEAGGRAELARRSGLTDRQIEQARAAGMTPAIAIKLWEACRIKLSKLLGRSVRCPHCQKEI